MSVLLHFKHDNGFDLGVGVVRDEVLLEPIGDGAAVERSSLGRSMVN